MTRRELKSKREAGRLGGLATLAKYGRGHFVELGAKGFASLVRNRFHGDKVAAIQELHDLADQRHLAAIAGSLSASELAGALTRTNDRVDDYIRKYRAQFPA